MKKFILILAAILIGVNTLKAQTPSFTGPSSAQNNATVTFSAVGESTFVYPYNPAYFINGITSVDGAPFTVSPFNFANIVNVTLVSVPNLYSNSNTPTRFQVKVSNPTTTAVTVTFQVRVNYVVYSQSGVASYSQVAVPCQIVIQPQPSIPVPPAGPSDVDLGMAPDGTYGGVLTNFLWRLQSKSDNRHFYTIDHNELVTLYHSGQYIFEGAIGYVYKTQQPGSSPLFHYYKTSNGEHYFTADQNEANSLAGNGWTYSGVTGYVPNSTMSNIMPVYHYMATSGRAGHFWTSNWNELGNGNSSWGYYGWAYYVFSVQQ